MLSTALLTKNRSPLHPPWSVGCSRVFCSFLRTLSHRKYPGKIPSSCSHPSSRQEPRQSMNFSRLSFHWRIVELLAEDSFSVFFVPFLCWAQTDGEAPSFFQSICRSPCAFCSGIPMFMVTPLLSASSLSSLLYFRIFDTCARLLITHSSSSFGLLAGRAFNALVAVLVRKSLIASAVFSVSTR